jgi:antirestriction protein
MHAAEVQEALDTIPEDMSDAVMAYCDNMSEDVLTVDVSRVEEAFAGEWESWDDYVSNYVEDTGMLSEVPEDVKRYFDYDSFGSDLMYDYWTADTRDGIMVFHSL